MTKSRRQRQQGNFFRGMKAEVALNCYTRALGFVRTRPYEVAIKLLEERIDYQRKELAECAAARRRQKLEKEPTV